jgi:hypothetical protein
MTFEDDVEQMANERGNEQRPVVLTARDRELFVHLAISRYLTSDQIAKLVFSGKTASIAPRRLRRLAAGKHQYVRRLPFRTKDGGMALAWTLKPLGYMAAHNYFRGTPEPPTHDPPGADFLEHDMVLNELYVALATAAKHKRFSFDRWPFRWLPSDSARLPWTELDSDVNTTATRLICPDATLEFLHLHRRIFIELETGTHTLGFNRDGPAGRNATKTKIERYARFVVAPGPGRDGVTFYRQAFQDGWPAELLFVVPSVARREAINEFVSHERTSRQGTFDVRALTLEEAPKTLCRAAELAAGTATPLPRHVAGALSSEEMLAVYDFYNAAIAAIGAVRQFAKSNPSLAAHLPVPDYPSNHEVVKQLCVRLGGVPR